MTRPREFVVESAAVGAPHDPTRTVSGDMCAQSYGCVVSGATTPTRAECLAHGAHETTSPRLILNRGCANRWKALDSQIVRSRAAAC